MFPILTFLAVLIISLVSMWKVFVKAGHPGWASIVPLYNAYVMALIGGKPGWWILLFLIPFVGIVIGILILRGVARNFGHGIGFTLGLIFLPFIFWAILAFSDDQYQGSPVVEQ